MLQVTDAAISVLKREILHQGEPLSGRRVGQGDPPAEDRGL
jgi:hypothetical protein